MTTKKLLVIGGPTASGKTELAIKLAQKFNTEIVNADSRQVYKDLSIGVAKPSPAQLAEVKHHLIGTVDLDQPYNAGIYEKEALACITEIFKTKDVAVLVGGTGLYIKSVIHGLDEFGENEEALNEIRAELTDKYETEGLETMVDMLISLDPSCENTISLTNPYRVLRALEQIKLHNKPLSEIRTGETKDRPFKTYNFYLNPERRILYQRINARVDEMMLAGLENEAKLLFPQKELKSLQTVGYSELFEYFDGNLTKEQAVEKIKQHTRNYAKRQVTYFKNILKGTALNNYEKAESIILSAIEKPVKTESTIFAETKKHTD